MRTKFLCVSILRVASGPRVKVASCKSALNPLVVVPVLVLLFVVLRHDSRNKGMKHS